MSKFFFQDLSRRRPLTMPMSRMSTSTWSTPPAPGPCFMPARSSIRRSPSGWPRTAASKSLAADGRYLTSTAASRPRRRRDNGHPVRPSSSSARSPTISAWPAGGHPGLRGSMIVLALLLPLVFWIASRLLQKQLLDPLFNLRGEAGPSPRAISTMPSPTPSAATRSASSPTASPRCATRCAGRSSTSRRPTFDRALRAARLPGDHRQAVDRRRSSSATTSART